MVQLDQDPRLAGDPVLPLGVDRRGAREHLQAHRLVKVGVHRPEQAAQRAGLNVFPDFVGPHPEGPHVPGQHGVGLKLGEQLPFHQPIGKALGGGRPGPLGLPLVLLLPHRPHGQQPAVHYLRPKFFQTGHRETSPVKGRLTRSQRRRRNR